MAEIKIVTEVAGRVCAIAASNGGEDVDQALLRAFRGARDGDPRRYAAATLIRQRGIDVDDATSRELDGLMGPQYGGYGYGG